MPRVIEGTWSKSTEPRQYKLHFGVQQSIRYHRHRERFFDRLHHVNDVICQVAGAATLMLVVAELPPEWEWTRLAAAITAAAAAAANLAMNPGLAARRHSHLATSFALLEKDIVHAGLAPPWKDLYKLETRRLEIDAHEPPVLRVLDATCHDEVIMALGQDAGHKSNVTRWQRLCRHFLDIGAHRLQKQQP